MHDTDLEEEERDYGPSRGEQRRQALAVLELAQRLVERSDADLARMPLDDDLRDLALATKADGRREAQALHRVEYWRDRLIADGDEALGEFVDAHPHADRQHLRQLARNAHVEKLKNKPPHAYRELFRELRDLLAAPDEDVTESGDVG